MKQTKEKTQDDAKEKTKEKTRNGDKQSKTIVHKTSDNSLPSLVKSSSPKILIPKLTREEFIEKMKKKADNSFTEEIEKWKKSITEKIEKGALQWYSTIDISGKIKKWQNDNVRRELRKINRSIKLSMGVSQSRIHENMDSLSADPNNFDNSFEHSYVDIYNPNYYK